MQLNSLVFPAPKASYSPKYHSDIVWIPKRVHRASVNKPKKTLFLSSPKYGSECSLNSTDRNEDTPKSAYYNSSRSFFKIMSPGPKKIRDFGSHNQLFSIKTVPFKAKPKKSGSPFSPKEKVQNSPKIPCYFYETNGGSSILFIHFHANAEDIGDSSQYMKLVCSLLKVNCLIVEYPGYGLYKGKCSSENILKDGEIVLEYLINELNIPSKRIVLMGRSVGSGPATYLASKYDVGALILLSAYTSLKKLVRDHYGKFVQWLIAERFENLERIKDVKCPILLIHGKKDELIPYQHAFELRKKVSEHVYSEVFLPENMTHNK